MKKIIILLLLTILLISCNDMKNEKINENENIELKINQFIDTELKYDTTLINESQKKVIFSLYKAAKIIDQIFLNQVYSKNIEIRESLINSNLSADKLKLKYFDLMFGPFDRLDEDKPFIGEYQKPLGANFYPEDMTKAEFNDFIKEYPENENSFTNEFTIIRRDDAGKLIAIPYSEYYKEDLTKISELLKVASQYAKNESLKNYLLKRADAFLSNDYFESDMAWMDLKDHLIEVVIGPYEVYEDKLFNYKASFECFLTIVDPAESEKLIIFENYLNEIERNLPIPNEHKNFNRGSESPIVVVQQIFSAGDTKAGVQTLAFNLPNDERVREAKGSKKVMIKNMHEAKFEKLLIPISEIVLAKENLKNVTFNGFFNHTLMHEMSHGVGPGKIIKDGKQTEVKKELKETYSTLEECKADILGMFNNLFMIEKKVYPEEFEKEIWDTFLAGIFRSIRFGINEAHGGGNAIILNYMLENGGYQFDSKEQKVSVNYQKAPEVLKKLASEVLMIQALGDYDAAKDIIKNYVVETEVIKTLTNKLKDLPVDIRPIYQIEKEMENL